MGPKGATTLWIVIELEVSDLFGSVILLEMSGKPNEGRKTGRMGAHKKIIEIKLSGHRKG